jgi:hypothetical protein
VELWICLYELFKDGCVDEVMVEMLDACSWMKARLLALESQSID